MGVGSGGSAAASADDPWAAPRSSAPAAPPEGHPRASLYLSRSSGRTRGRRGARDQPRIPPEDTGGDSPRLRLPGPHGRRWRGN
eukprot:2018172-Pyramimonas_sp.AAC.1